MSRYVVLLRAVNVGGTGKLSMAAFRAMLEGLGYARVETYIQSGNAVLTTPAPPDKVLKAITAGLEKLMGATPGVILRTHADLDRLIAGNPFAAEAAADGSKVLVAFLSGPAGPEAKVALDSVVAKYPARRDRFHLDGDAIYFHFPDGAADTKFTGKTLDKAIGVPGTARNWNTVLKLHAMSRE